MLRTAESEYQSSRGVETSKWRMKSFAERDNTVVQQQQQQNKRRCNHKKRNLMQNAPRALHKRAAERTERDRAERGRKRSLERTLGGPVGHVGRIEEVPGRKRAGNGGRRHIVDGLRGPE